MTSPTGPSVTGDLTLGHVLSTTGLDLADFVVVRHTYRQGEFEPGDDSPERLLEFTRRQSIVNKLGKTPPFHWLVFLADGGRRSRLLIAYENHGEMLAERTDDLRFFDLRSSEVLSSLANRLVVEWSGDTVNWAKKGPSTAKFPVVEIADPEVVPFPGFDRVLVKHAELQAVVSDAHYSQWQTALAAVQGIYLIADTSTGQLYVGKADGGERLLSRWTAYARDGHGSNLALRDLVKQDPDHAGHFQFSILRVFGPSVPTAEVDEAEAHYKRALLSRKYGLNRN